MMLDSTYRCFISNLRCKSWVPVCGIIQLNDFNYLNV